MKLDKKIENQIKKECLRLLVDGRPNWDVKHTISAVKWMKKLIETEGGNEKILIPAIYLHDVGYEKLPTGYSHELMMKNKKEKDHGLVGSRIAAEYLPKLKYFSGAEIKRIAYLIKNHNKHKNIKQKDRQLIFESDTMAQIDYENCPPNYDYKNLKEFLDTTFQERIKYINTKTGKKLLKELLPKAKNYLNNMSR